MFQLNLLKLDSKFNISTSTYNMVQAKIFLSLVSLFHFYQQLDQYTFFYNNFKIINHSIQWISKLIHDVLSSNLAESPVFTHLIIWPNSMDYLVDLMHMR